MTGANEFRATASTPEQAHAAVLRAYAHAKALTMNGERVVITAGPALDPIGVRQRNFYHGVVLQQISEQARSDGTRYTLDIWKEFYRRLFLPDTWASRRLPGQRRAVPTRVRHSTEELGPRAYAIHIDRVVAHAATDLGVAFQFDPEERAGAQPAPRPRRSQPAATNQPEDPQ
jgi:hypothetical protein